MADVETVEVDAGAESKIEPEDGWRVDRQGRHFAPARGRSGVVYRQGIETVDEAHTRDAKGPKDRKPKPKARPKPPAPTSVSLKELEWELAEGLKAPAMICAGFGDEWAANHFTREGPVLARNLIKAAEHNPWLRAKIEAAMSGEDLMVKLITALGVAGAVFAYAVPPLIHFTNPGFVSPEARAMFGVPPRAPKRDAPPAAPAAPAEAAAPPSPVAAAA